jgi:hypothetical protein
VINRGAHAQALLAALDTLQPIALDLRPGAYLEIEGRQGEPLAMDSLNSSGLKLLQVKPGGDNLPAIATVYASDDGVRKFRKKVEQFRDEETRNGRPKNADLVQSIAAITEAGLQALWKGPPSRFPAANHGAVPWEIWLEREHIGEFRQLALQHGLQINNDQLEFPEEVVVLISATPAALANVIRHSARVRALAPPATTAAFFDDLPIEEQVDWTNSIQNRTTFESTEATAYITLLDTGANRAHPLVAPALSAEDRHAADPAWGVEDVLGHGTKLAGLTLFGDLSISLQSTGPIAIFHRLESVKVIPDVGQNPNHLLGFITRSGVDAVEAVAERNRTFTLATTTPDDTPHDGAPTSWSTELDQLASGVSGIFNHPRLLLVSAGNSDQNNFIHAEFLPVADDPANEIESPAQSWNVISVGAYTEKVLPPFSQEGVSLAPFGELSPNSRTASWDKQWPIKPEIVMEGGNWVVHQPPPMRHQALSLLTTDHQFPTRSFTTCDQTSAATALAAKAITELWVDYPNLWPETVRALFISSARWNQQMRSHLPNNAPKSAFTKLFKRYGYGIPDLSRARKSASNSVTLIVQDTIVPYRLNDSGANAINNEMKIFELPWPSAELRKLAGSNATLRVTLSTFIEPNPSEVGRGKRYNYASHNLRFHLNRPGEKLDSFLNRISKPVDDDAEDLPQDDSNDGWDFGYNRRSVGSLHIDQLTCDGSDLANRNLFAVFPVGGWKKTRLLEIPQIFQLDSHSY